MQNSSPPNSIRAHVIVSRRVQGVGYRFSTLDEANSRGITGWVRNLPDGRVEAVFEGTEETVTEMIRWCDQGPPTSVVKDVFVEYQKPEGLQQFDIRR
ncbi:acylphosphatase [Microcoleus sp. FACHB-672]|uniref:acylphosphatase n=1 Tax=Microcoleus sp. FACHB-672 TaxID=2692825 RepID=UPI00168A2094|nr:acylphosphatase [Microcoleus sp. FACHB-672]MBD2043564.1 acylphosphatase [Microcoleus sp. FACHB-672]